MRLEASGVAFRYGDGGSWLFEDVSLSLGEGERVALVGPSGCGKSTLLKLLAGYERPGRGAVLLDGRPLPAKGFSPVQLIFQHPEQAINPRWKMRKVLAEAGVPDDGLMSAMGIEPAWLDRYPRELSGGELQRFCIARSLADGVRFLLADEITTMLDVITQALIWRAVLAEAERRGLGLLMVTHNRELAARVCRRIITMEEADA